MRDLQPIGGYEDPQLRRRIVFNSLLAIVLSLALLGWGWLQRTNAINATVFYEDERSGLRAQIPLNWILSQGVDDTVFRVENPQARPFKTTIQVSVQAVGDDAVPRNIVDQLKLQGPVRLTGYTSRGEEIFRLGEDEAVRIEYAYIQVELNPFLEAVPIVILGEDVVVLRDNQAIIITYREAEVNFERHRFYFENFLTSLEY
jgi:hypothetical protein